MSENKSKNTVKSKTVAPEEITLSRKSSDRLSESIGTKVSVVTDAVVKSAPDSETVVGAAGGVYGGALVEAYQAVSGSNIIEVIKSTVANKNQDEDDGIPEGKKKIWAKRSAVADVKSIEAFEAQVETLDHLENVETLDAKRHKELIEAIEGSGEKSSSLLGSITGALGTALSALAGGKVLGVFGKKDKSKAKSSKSKKPSKLKGRAKILASLASVVGLGKLASNSIDNKDEKTTSRQKTTNEPKPKGKLKNTFSKSKALLKRIPWLGALLTAYMVLDEIESQDKKTSKRDKIIKAGGVIGGGIAGGAVGGAVLGGAVGSIIPIVGTAIGGAIGAILGGIIGSSIGGWVSDAITTALDLGLDGVVAEISKSMNDLNTWVNDLTGLNIKDSLSPALDAISGVYDDAILAISDFKKGVTEFKDKILNWFDDSATELNKTIERKTGVNVSDELKTATEVVNKKISKVTNTVKEFFGFGNTKKPTDIESQIDSLKTKKVSKSNKERDLELALGFQGGRIAGMSDAESRAFAGNTARTESDGNKRAINKYGYVGKYQFGAEALEDVGLIKKGSSKRARKGMSNSQWYGKNLTEGKISPHEKFIKNNENWKIKGGLNTYLDNEKLQDKKFAGLTSRNIRSGLRRHSIDKSSSVGVIAAYAKAAHLKGNGGAGKLFKNGVSSTDANGMSTLRYAKQGSNSVKFLAPRVANAINKPKTALASSPVSIKKLNRANTKSPSVTVPTPAVKPSRVPIARNKPTDSKQQAKIIGQEVGKEVVKAMKSGNKAKKETTKNSQIGFAEHIPTGFDETHLALAANGRT